MIRWITGKYGDMVPLAVFLTVLAVVYVLDREQTSRPEELSRAVVQEAERRAAMLADRIGNAVNERTGAMSAAEILFTTLEDSVSRRTIGSALDTITSRFEGLMGLSAIYAGGQIQRGPGAAIESRGAQPHVDTALGNAYRRAEQTGRPAATPLVSVPNYGRRVFVFDPVVREGRIAGQLVGELDPALVLRVAQSQVTDSLRDYFWALYGPNNSRISTQPLPPNWDYVTRPVRVADSEWTVRLAYAPVNLAIYRTQRIAIWLIGLSIALALSSILLFLRRTVGRQREEISRRQAAEEAARRNATEARERASEARELAGQLEAAQRASQRLSTSLNPDDVVELFLGGVAEILDADVASLYTFEEEGEVLVGRRRIVFRDFGPATQRLYAEDIRQVRSPVALLPSIAEAVSTGEPQIEVGQPQGPRGVAAVVGSETAASRVTIPLMIAGHMVGVATWEIHTEQRTFSPAAIAFAQGMAAPAAAALRTAELFATLEEERARARREALRFAAVLDQMADGVVMVDAQGSVERYNKAAEELIGPGLDSVRLEDWATRFNITNVEGRPLSGTEFPLVRALRGDRIRRSTFIVHHGGNERHLSGSAGPILTGQGNPAGAAMIVRDVSDEHQYAEMLRHTNRELRRQADVLEEVNRQLREATKAKDQFLAVMSHELRTPINAIMGYSDLLDLGVKGELNPEQRAMVGRVRETSRHLLGLINEVLDLAKIGAGRMDLVLVELDVAAIVDRAAQQILPMANAKGLSLTVQTFSPQDASPHVIGDETRLTQIIINLLSNAVKFTMTGGISVRYGVVEGNVEVRVRDTGPGVPEDQRERIFEEFYQVEGGLSRSTGGTGLGLAIARRFAHLMGGDIHLESEIGAGSEFTLTLPCVAGQPEPVRDERLPTVVFLASAEMHAAEVTAELARKVRVLATTEPGRVAGIARQENADLIALDTVADDYGAWRALAALQADPETAVLKVALLAANGESGEAVDIGSLCIMTKPLAIERAVAGIRAGLPEGSEAPILIADDDPDTRTILEEALRAAGRETVAVSDAAEAWQLLENGGFGAAIIDLLLPGDEPGVLLIARLRNEPSLAEVAIFGLVGKELSTEEMTQLSRAIERHALTGNPRIVRIAEILQQAATPAGEATESGVTVA